ncbi:hypothetical protein PC129_g21900 [Phytophthora cactorum]|uniref:Uncharacterized protein n=1 Tax=Phytophthora cactorum TaxID=29920 RepID=A0A8T1K7N6_9STRA|nr:hypothetical protein Pcac1_g21687 [Phytophthora cactorum]KAG2793041.1 hypothetical protein PC111_g23200 [Phytophthora cactorum]KAG2872675.1 hypothetical protein PC114_g26261 [Phytophthora cactorum]KAG2878846.1 hypothetical protein PC115_g22958 [Phytophthora cactorum]KAG2883606.1 hypothetical protein PC117_g25988 [Phytophthora cactorum]
MQGHRVAFNTVLLASASSSTCECDLGLRERLVVNEAPPQAGEG